MRCDEILGGGEWNRLPRASDAPARREKRHEKRHMCVEKREERHEKRETHVCGRVRVRTGN